MAGSARLVATVPAPLHPASADGPKVLHWPDRRLLVQRGDTELVTVDLRTPADGPKAEVRFAAPWPRSIGTATVSPEQDAALFCGVHELRLVDADGGCRWSFEHGSWAGTAEDDVHADGGSAAFSCDGSLVWAHVPDAVDGRELWVVLDARTGGMLGRAETMTVASYSEHTPHPDPRQMGLSVGEGEEGSPALWGRFDGRELTVEPIGAERILLDVSPNGQRILTAPVGQWSLTLHAAADRCVQGELDAAQAVPRHPAARPGSRVYWDFEAAFVDDATIVAGTSECDPGHGAARHWLVDARDMTVGGAVVYPLPVAGPARSAGGGTWYTVTKDGATVHLWQL